MSGRLTPEGGYSFVDGIELGTDWCCATARFFYQNMRILENFFLIVTSL